MAGDSDRIISTVKAALRTRGMTYAALARRIGLSETSVKRVLSRGTLSLRRLEQICDAMDISVSELVQQMHASTSGRVEMLTLRQEKALAADPRLFACYHLVANGRSNREIAADMHSSQQAVQQYLSRLKTLGLVTQPSKDRAEATTTAAVKWRTDGPVRQMYEREVQVEFLQSLFSAPREALHFRSAELSASSCRILQRKLDRLATEFRDLADLDRTLPPGDKRHFGCLLAMRPWVSSRFLNSLRDHAG